MTMIARYAFRLGCVASRIALAFGLVLGAVSPAAAWLANEAISRIFPGQTLVGEYADGIRFRDAYSIDGQIAYQDERVSWRGEWYVAAGLFCTFYNGGVNGGCFRVLRLSDNCFAFYGTEERPDPTAPDDSKSKSVPDLPLPGDQNYVATGWIESRPGTCVEVGV